MKNPAFEKEIESYRVEIDYLKHLTTVSSASILVLLVFAEKFTGKLQNVASLGWALVLLVFAIVGALWVHLRLVWNINEKDISKESPLWMASIDAAFLIGGFLAFVSAMSIIAWVAFEIARA